jgi:hypothetical protein
MFKSLCLWKNKSLNEMDTKYAIKYDFQSIMKIIILPCVGISLFGEMRITITLYHYIQTDIIPSTLASYSRT